MAMDGNARGDTDYNAIAAANPNWSKLSTAEMNTAKMYFEILFSADTGYIQGNADVSPTGHSGELQNPAGQPVTVDTNTGMGQTTAPENITGLGKIL